MPLYKADPNDSTKQIPNNQPNDLQFSHAECPTHSTITKRPTYVNVNVNGTYAFAYSSASAALGTSTTNYITGSVHPGANAGPFKLDISPVAWKQVDGSNVGGTVGDITFVYVRVR